MDVALGDAMSWPPWHGHSGMATRRESSEIQPEAQPQRVNGQPQGSDQALKYPHSRLFALWFA